MQLQECFSTDSYVKMVGEDLSAVGGTEGAGIVDELVGQTLGSACERIRIDVGQMRSTICGRGSLGRGGLV